ncbi:hypothetical protein AKG43_04620 [Neisseria sp. 74A18]|nr:hypothetical protein AKG43_04620 [Neisseria sp. 74A18]
MQKSRSLTQGEIDLAKQVFKDSIDYAKVKVHKGEYLLWVQDNNTAMTPNGEMHFPDKTYKNDFSATTQPSDKHLFIHEMVHVWQYQLGYDVKKAGLVIATQGGYKNSAAYKYDNDILEKKDLSEFNMEQQGNIIADYYMFTQGVDFRPSTSQQNRERVLAKFKVNPNDSNLLPKTTVF